MGFPKFQWCKGHGLPQSGMGHYKLREIDWIIYIFRALNNSLIQIKSIPKEYCIILAKNQEEMAHIIDENISVINVTRVEMSENRQAINKIISSLSLLDSKIGNIT